MICSLKGVRKWRGLPAGEWKYKIIGEMAIWTEHPDGTFTRHEYRIFGTIRTGQHGTVFDG